MSLTHISPRIRGFICTTAHPEGCAAHVAAQVKVASDARATTPAPERPPRVLVIGASTGYGLAARIAATFLYGSPTIGLFYERPGDGTKTASPGWYNTAAFDADAKKGGFDAYHLNGDAFSDAAKEKTIARIKETFGKVDIVIYSLASPRRTDPETGTIYSSVLKPIGEAYHGKTVELNTETVTDVTIQPATDDEITGTVHVMGGEDLVRWADALLSAGVLAEGAKIIPLSYIGPAVTYPIYRSGTIGYAKEHIEAATHAVHAKMQAAVGGSAIISVNKAVVTQASAAIPTVPLYYSVLTAILKARGQHEEPIHQMVRLFTTHLAPDATLTLDAQGRIRLDDYEMAADVQEEVMRRWPQITTETFRTLGDWDDYKRGFRNLFGFEVEGVEYDGETEVERPIAVETV